MIKININKIYKQDCIQGMKELIEKGYSKYFDFIEIDPPYNIGKDVWDKFESYEEYLKFIEEVIDLSSQLMSDNGTLFLWHNDILVLSDFIQLIKTSTDLKLKQQCIWNKYYKYNDNGTANNQYGFMNGFIQSDMNRNYQKMCEYALYYTKQDETGVNCIDKDIAPRNPFRRELKKARSKVGLTITQVAEKGKFYGNINHGGAVTNWEKGYNIPNEEQWEILKSFLPIEEKYHEYKVLKEEYENLRYTFNSDKNNFRSCIWQYPMSKETKHKTEKPLQLYLDMFEVHTKQNSKCLFPFVGSGNNIMSLLDINKADNGNREYIGFETDDKWFELINNRINKL